MKRFLFFCLLLVVGAALFAQDKPLELDMFKDYLVKSTDGSGMVPLYNDDVGNVSSVSVPDDTEFQTLREGRNRYEVRYKGKRYWIDKKNFYKEVFGRAEERKKADSNRIMFSICLWIFIVITFIRLYKGNKKRAVKIYGKYYKEKCKQFAWLVNWLNRNADPIVPRAHEAAKKAQIVIVIGFLVLGFLLSWLVTKMFPDTAFGIHQNFVIWSFAVIVFTFIVCQIIGRAMLKHPATSSDIGSYPADLKLECPFCGCPHAWGMVFSQCFVEKSETTTTTVKKWKEDSYGNKIAGTSTSENYTSTVYSGREIRDYHCENCEKTDHREFGNVWYVRPSEGPWHHSPPVKAWG